MNNAKYDERTVYMVAAIDPKNTNRGMEWLGWTSAGRNKVEYRWHGDHPSLPAPIPSPATNQWGGNCWETLKEAKHKFRTNTVKNKRAHYGYEIRIIEVRTCSVMETTIVVGGPQDAVTLLAEVGRSDDA